MATQRAAARPKTQSLAADDFFYFFLRVRKSRVKKVVERVQALHPSETREEHARRLVDSATQLALVAGGLLHAPMLFPGVGAAVRALGLVGGASALTRMNLYLILEIAHLYGRDIDDPERVSEMIAVVGATMAAATLPSIAMQALEVLPVIGLPATALSTSAATRLIGGRAIVYYSEALPSAPILAAAESAASH